MDPVGYFCNREVVICERGDTLAEAARRMRDHRVGCVIVVEGAPGARVPVGILTDRDIVIRTLASGVAGPGARPVGDFMSVPLATAREGASLVDTLKQMRAFGVRRMPVVDQRGLLQGIIALDDMIDLLSEEMSDLAELLGRELRPA